MSFEIQIGPPRAEFKALAEKELRENEENVKNGIETLKKLLEGKAIVSYALIVKKVTSVIFAETAGFTSCDIYLLMLKSYLVFFSQMCCCCCCGKLTQILLTCESGTKSFR